MGNTRDLALLVHADVLLVVGIGRVDPHARRRGAQGAWTVAQSRISAVCAVVRVQAGDDSTRKRQREREPGASRGAFRPDLPAVGLNDPPRNVEA